MRRYINLLPPTEQQELRGMQFSSHIREFAIWLCLSLGVLAMFFVAIRFYLKGELENSESRLAAEKELLDNVESSVFREDLDRFNGELADFQTLQGKQNKYSEVLVEIAQRMPKDMTLDTFTLDDKTGRIEIGGRAASRNSVLALRNSLLQSERFANINFPLTNLEKRTNVSWEYRFFLKKPKAQK